MADFFYPLTLGIEKQRVVTAKDCTDQPLRPSYEIWCEGLQRLERVYEELPADQVLTALKQAAVTHKFWLIRGEPGAGKTTLLEHWRTQATADCVPVLVRLREFGESDWRLEVGALAAQFWARGCEETDGSGVYAGPLPSQPLWLLDGLDEVTPACLKRELYRKLANLPGCTVITCRTAVYARLQAEADAYRQPERNYEVLGLRSAKEKQTFLTSYFGDEQRAQALQQRIAKHAPLRFLAGNPQMLSLIADVSERIALPATRAAFYREAVSQLWARKLDAGDPAEWLDNERDELLTQLAQRMGVNEIEAARSLLMPCARAVAGANAEHLLAALKKTGLLRIDDTRGCFSFRHLTFQEYYLARALQSDGLQAALKKHWDDVRYEETLSLLVSLLAEEGQCAAIEQGLRWLIAWGAETHQRDPQILWKKGRSPLRTALHVWGRSGVRKPEAVAVEGMLWSAVQVDALRRQAVARDPKSPHEVLSRLAGDESASVRRSVAENTGTPGEVLSRLAGDESEYVCMSVAENAGIPGEVLSRLAGDKSESVRMSVAEKAGTPGEVLSRLAGDESEYVRMSVAGNAGTPGEVLSRLSEDEDANVRMMVALNAMTPVEVLRQLAEDKDADVRVNVAENVATPVEVLRQLAEDKDADVRKNGAWNAAMLTLFKESIRSPMDKNALVHESEEWNMLMKKFPLVRRRVARNAATPEDVLRRLAKDEDHVVRYEVATNAATPEDVLIWLSKNENVWVRVSVATNAATPVEVLSRLSSDEDAGVCWRAAVNPATLLEDLGELKNFPFPIDHQPAPSIESLFTQLNPRDQLETIMLRLNMPTEHRPSSDLELVKRETKVIDWAKRKDGGQHLIHILNDLIAEQYQN